MFSLFTTEQTEKLFRSYRYAISNQLQEDEDFINCCFYFMLPPNSVIYELI